jgi:hypothetical protein
MSWALLLIALNSNIIIEYFPTKLECEVTRELNTIKDGQKYSCVEIKTIKGRTK